VHGIRQEVGVSIEGAEEGGIQYDQLKKYCMDDCREIKDFIKKGFKPGGQNEIASTLKFNSKL
jgi:hypothetical protein